MRFFHYQATDSNGRATEGTIRAATPDAAMDALRQSGYRVTALGDRPAAPVRPASVQASAPVVGPSSTPDAPTPVAIVKTRRGKDNDLYFLFSQFGNLFRAGVTPVQAFDTLASRVPARYAESLREMGRNTGERGRISDVMERYPYLYPPDVVGTIRAGETAGFLPEAAQKVADQMQSSHRLKRRLGWIFAYLLIMMALMPMIYAILQGSLASIAQQNQADGNLPVIATLRSAVGKQVGSVLPWSIATAVAGLALIYGWNTMPLRELRHRLMLRFPFAGKRIWAEAMARFTWASGMISRGGMPPQKVFELAADTVPNHEIRERLRTAAQGMRETERLSEAIRRSRILPPEYASIVETGEMTGDVPRALDQVARAAGAEFETRDRGTAKRLTIVFMLLIGAFVLIVLATFYRMYFSGIITTLTQDPT